ncbi:MAG: hypothetical protein Q4D29_03735 [Lachnospiraceae bacterium]|nr:hypothetical protein [Lachnospiraceae bacterium]
MAVAVIFLMLMLLFKQHKEKLLVCGILVMSLISGVYCYTHAESILPSRQTKTQTFYNTDFLKSEEYVDAFLRLFLNGKNVYVKCDKWELDPAQDAGYEWLYAFYHVYNMENYLNSVNANIIEDESMNSVTITDDKAENFEELGYLNDLMRNTMLYTNYDYECGNYFYYLWYYRDATDTAYIYANEESLSEDELVLIWQSRSEDNVETEDMYLMGKRYYEENIK